MNFLLVNEFDPFYYVEISAIPKQPFYINLDHISKITVYDPEIHATSKLNHSTGEYDKVIPDGALKSVYVYMDKEMCHLDVESSKKLMAIVSYNQWNKDT